ncbi:DUF427 domain-containing protein [Amycolatopsis sp. Poz14]|uniref:DUF427 domain-containing protein n=1 Tax=Amycolatopsis sp. Poz14 TaxID=1447705 RepID=UPI001EE8D1BB|nr:DUF427 domain-containing protein [Amycolatopsis sp. Poz14]MCG3755462.1 DUF427 domain-containing protein [Amycolatopsis sp. Poz14]
MTDYPAAAVQAGHVEPVPRRVRGVLAGKTIVDSTRAKYVWEWPYYPQFYFPLDDVLPGALVSGDDGRFSLRVGEVEKPAAAWVNDSVLPGHVRFDWDALDAWFEEDEQVFVHPRNPYTRVDALRSTRHVRVRLNGVTLAASSSPVLLFETGLPTRYYFNRTEVDFTHLVAEPGMVTACPYKGETSGYWSVRVGDVLHEHLAWTYAYPAAAVQPIAGLVAFYNEMVDIEVDGELLPRPRTHFSQ